MAQILRVLKGDPSTVVGLLNGYATSETIVEIQKTFSNGEFVVVFDDAAAGGQTAVVIKGAPVTAAQQIESLISGSTSVIMSDTFSASSYILVYN